MQHTYSQKGVYVTGMLENCCRISHLVDGNADASYSTYMLVDLNNPTYDQSPTISVESVMRVNAGETLNKVFLPNTRYPVKFSFQDTRWSNLVNSVPTCNGEKMYWDPQASNALKVNM